MLTQTKQTGIFSALILLMAITRGSHFGSSINFPDATLAIFLIAGLMLPRLNWIALAAFTTLLLEAGGLDYYAIVYRGVSDYCVSPAYIFLIPTYASMWLGGRWFSSRLQKNWQGLAIFAGTSWLATTIAFLISNGAFYLLSGRFTDMSAVEYASRVTKYYPPYLSGSLMYLAIAAFAYVMFVQLNKTNTNPAQH